MYCQRGKQVLLSDHREDSAQTTIISASAHTAPLWAANTLYAIKKKRKTLNIMVFEVNDHKNNIPDRRGVVQRQCD